MTAICGGCGAQLALGQECAPCTIKYLKSKLGECEKERLNALDALGKVYDGLKGTQSKLAAAEKERDRAVAKAARMTELDPDGERADDDMQEALREIEDLTVGNVNHENTIATLQSRLSTALKLLDSLLGELPTADPRVEKVCKFLAENAVETWGTVGGGGFSESVSTKDVDPNKCVVCGDQAVANTSDGPVCERHSYWLVDGKIVRPNGVPP